MDLIVGNQRLTWAGGWLCYECRSSPRSRETSQTVANDFEVLADLDSKGDGRVQQSEYHHLSDLGISSLNYQMGTYSKTDGSPHQMATLTLQAQTEGRAYSAKPDGIQIDSITGQVLLDNDHVSNAPNAVLKVSGVQNAQGGTVSLDANAGTVTFAPNVGFYGAAGFDYAVEAGLGQRDTKRVVVNAAKEVRYACNSGMRLFYLGYSPKTFSKVVANEFVWRRAA